LIVIASSAKKTIGVDSKEAFETRLKEIL